MNRFMALSAMLHGVLVGALAVWGGALPEQGVPEAIRVRILDERPGDAAAAGADETSAMSPPAAEREAAGSPVAAAGGREGAIRPAPPVRRRLQAPREAEADPAPEEAATAAVAAAEPAPGAAAAVAARAGTGSGGRVAGERDGRIAEIRARIQAALLYPRQARRQGVEGTVHLRFALAEDGRLRRLAVRRSSGERVLDRASLDTVRRAQPFPYVEGDLDVPVVFRLTEKGTHPFFGATSENPAR